MNRLPIRPVIKRLSHDFAFEETFNKYKPFAIVAGGVATFLGSFTVLILNRQDKIYDKIDQHYEKICQDNENLRKDNESRYDKFRLEVKDDLRYFGEKLERFVPPNKN